MNKQTPTLIDPATDPNGEGIAGTFPYDIREGLTAPQKTIPSKYLYDELGSQIFEAICFLPEYYLTRTETALLEAHADEIANRLAPDCHLVELGAGSAIKTRILIRTLLARGGSLVYCPIDISEEAMLIAEANIVSAFPRCSFRGVVGDWIDSLGRLREMDRSQRLIVFLGSSIGNLDAEEAVRFLGAVRDRMGRDDKILLGTDLAKDPDELVAAYDDAIGVTAAFNLNLLVRINNELGGHFDPGCFRHEARWNGSASRIEMHLVSKIPQEIRVDALGLTVAFREGESIHTENSHKYTEAMLDRILNDSGLVREATWMDPEERYAVHLIGPDGPLGPPIGEDAGGDR